MSTQIKAYLEPFTQREGTNIIDLPVPHQLGTLMGSLMLLWSWVLFRTHKTCCYCFNQVAVFRGQFNILVCKSFFMGVLVAGLCIQSAVFIKRLVAGACIWARASVFWLSVGVSSSWARLWKTERTTPGSYKWTQMSFHISWSHKGSLVIIYPSNSHCLKLKVNSFRTAQCSCKELMVRVYEWSPAKPPWI